LAFEVALATAQLVLLKQRQPSRAEIAALVRRKMPCSEKTVERAHIRLAELGLLAWETEYIIGKRGTLAGCVPQARRTANVYRFVLPAAPVPVPPPRLRAIVCRLHSCDRQADGVNLKEASPPLPLSRALPPVATLAELEARHRRRYEEAQASKRTRGWIMVG
jgi:hypothetical protein